MISQHERDLLEDLQLRDDDRTEDLRPTHENAPGLGATRSEGMSPSNRSASERN